MDSISEAALMSPWATPRMQDMFVEWVEIIDRRMIGNPDMPGRIDIDAKADGSRDFRIDSPWNAPVSPAPRFDIHHGCRGSEGKRPQRVYLQLQ